MPTIESLAGTYTTGMTGDDPLHLKVSLSSGLTGATASRLHVKLSIPGTHTAKTRGFAQLTRKNRVPNLFGIGHTLVHKRTAWLVAPDGSEVAPLFIGVTKNLNKGWEWHCTFPSRATIPAFSSNSVWKVATKTSDGIQLSPPLAAPRPMNHFALNGFSKTLTGVDMASWKLGTQGLSNPVSKNISSAAVLSALAGIAGISIINPPNVMLEQYSLSGSTMQRHLEDILGQLGFSYRIGPSGEVVCFPAGFWYDTSTILYCSNVDEVFDDSKLLTGIHFIKSSASTGSKTYEYTKPGLGTYSLPSPLVPGSITAQDHPQIGQLGYIAFKDVNGAVCRVLVFNSQFSIDAGYGPFSSLGVSTLPAVSMEYGAMPPNAGSGLALGKFTVSGNVFGLGGYDYKFRIDYPNDNVSFDNPLHPRSDTLTELLTYGGVFQPDGVRVNVPSYISTLWPTMAYVTNGGVFDVNGHLIISATALLAVLWIDLQKGYDVVHRTISRFDPFFDCGDTMAADQYAPEARCESVTWDMTPSRMTQVISGYVPLALPTGAYAYLVPQTLL